MIETGIYQALRNDGTVSSFVNVGTSVNIFPVLMPKGTVLPAIVFSFVSRGSINSFDGANPLEVGRVQIDSYAKDSYYTTRKMSDALKALFVPSSELAHNYPYRLPDGSLIQAAMVHMDQDMPYEIGEGGLFVYRSLLDIEFSFVSS